MNNYLDLSNDSKRNAFYQVAVGREVRKTLREVLEMQVLEEIHKVITSQSDKIKLIHDI